ncbi:MAG: SDR family NAD(P)-dependent oxidoreductase [Actinophytocola sp.]|nr:SDR family NAD(P)-dependent oxidoreductase [Actinophytocola sp.]
MLAREPMRRPPTFGESLDGPASRWRRCRSTHVQPGTREDRRLASGNLDPPIDPPTSAVTAIGERMLARGRGHVVLIASLSGKSATPVSSLYNATKFGLRGFALALRQDWEPLGVGVSCVNPGPIAGAGMFHEGGADLPKGVRRKTPEDVADAVVRAIRTNRAEVDVADPVMRAGAWLSLAAPQTAARLGRIDGAERVARQLAEGHAENR